jgi:hydrogenase/urease accessory protein HupE
VAAQYTLLGVRHILEGIDHLLFLVCLLMVARTPRRIAITITGFTLAHSVTLILSALDLVRVPVEPLEAAIALSIVFVATEIARGRRDVLTYRHPIAVSTSFGLLHGFGFAAVLNEIGLPQTELAASLLFFNVGVELGQLAFLAASLVVWTTSSAAARRVAAPSTWQARARAAEPSAAYLIGSTASFWMIDRVSRFW